jgi:hypothetical protein
MITKQHILKDIKSHNKKQKSWIDAYQIKKELLEKLNDNTN